MATISTSQYLDSGTARTAGEAHAIGSGAVLTIRTDTRIHANAPASATGSLGNPTFTDIGGELFIDATAVREVSYTGGSGNSPAIGTTISQGGVSGYYLGAWASIGAAPTASGSALPASGILKFREITGGSFAAGALTGITATCSGADRPSWIEVVFDAGANIVVGRIGKIKSRGQWYEIGTTNGSQAQQLLVPTTSSAITNVFAPGVWVETATAGVYEFFPGLASSANGWSRINLGYPDDNVYHDARGKFVKTFGSGVVQFGESVNLSVTYASVGAQNGTYAGIAISGTYTWASDVVTVNTGATAHLLDTGQQTGLDFTSGTGADAIFTVTVLDAYNFTVPYVGSITGGNVTVRPGVTITFTAHGLNQGENTYCDFTSGTGVDGTYQVYSVDSANAYKVAYPHLAALTSGNVSCLHTLVVAYTAHGHALGNEVYFDVYTGGAADGIYTMKAVTANNFNINYAHSAAIGSGTGAIWWGVAYVPPTGRKVRIPNILVSECATGARALNTVPNATIGSRPEFDTSTAGAIDLEYIYSLSLRSTFAQPYSVHLANCAFSESLTITECATALDVTNVGVGMYSAQDVRALQLTSNFAGGTLSTVVAHRATIGTTDHATEILSCSGLTINDLSTGIIGYARSTGKPINIDASQNITLNNPRVFNGNVDIAASVGITINDLDYNDRYIGRTTATTPYYALTVAKGCDQIKLDGMTCGIGNTIADCHPYTGIISVTQATNVKARNIGSSSDYMKTGVWAPNYAAMGTAFVSGGNNNTLKFQRMFFTRLRTSLASTNNFDKNVTYEQVLSSFPWLHSAKAVYTTTLPSLNTSIKGITTGAILASGQTSVYGTHWLDTYQGNQYGAIVLNMNEPSTETLPYYTNVAGVVKFNSAGGVEMRAIGAEAIWEMPYFAQGHTGFANVTPVMSGGTIGNYTITYQIDTGSGWNGTWNTLNTTNLTAETISPSTGFKLKIKIVTGTTNSTAITFLRIATLTTLAAQNAVAYPLDTTTLTLTGLVANSDVTILAEGTETVLNTTEDWAGTTYDYTYETPQSVDIAIYQPGYIPFFIRDYTLPSSNASLPCAQVPDSTYLT